MAEHEHEQPAVEIEAEGTAEVEFEAPLRDEEESIMEAFVRHQRDAAVETRKAVASLIPEGFKSHSREARRAFRRSFKVLLEGIADRIEVEEDDDAPSTTGQTKIKVEVS